MQETKQQLVYIEQWSWLILEWPW